MNTIPNLQHSSRDGSALQDHFPWRRWVLLVALGLGALGCSAESKSEPVTSSQTHWLEQCEKASDCGADFACTCGVCTTSCEGDSSCADLGNNAVCADTQGVVACGNSAPANICVQGCDKDTACGTGTSCVDGACVPLAEGQDAGATDPPPAPPGVRCSDYVACDVDTSCVAGSCYSFPGCGGAVCIDGDEACALSCPEGNECLTLDSYPAQLSCEGFVPAIGGDPMGQPEPEGLDCSEHYACGVDLPCDEGDCISFDECNGGICVPADEACDATCPEADECRIAESYPLQLFCDGRVAPKAGTPMTPNVDVDPMPPAQDSGAGPKGVDCSAHASCGVGNSTCAQDETCITIRGCDAPVCIVADDACGQTCPNPDECGLLESFPLQLACEGYVEGHGASSPSLAIDAGSNEGVICGDNICPVGERCCNHCNGSCTSLELVCPDDIDPAQACQDAGAQAPVCDNDADPDCDTASTFACGTEGCDATTSYCVSTQGDEDTFGCEAWPAECLASDRSCDCLMIDAEVGSCAETSEGEVTVTIVQP